MKKIHTIDEVAEFSHISVRTLRHYDEIALLKPLSRNESGHRVYGENELLRLQQILFYKKLDLSLMEIKQILDDKSFDLTDALETHRRVLFQKKNQIDVLIKTIDKTISHIKYKEMINEQDLYEGFTDEEVAQMKEDAVRLYDPSLMKESQDRDKKRSMQEWSELKTEGGEIIKDLMGLMDTKDPSDLEVQQVVERQYAFISKFFEPTTEIFRAIGQGYAQDPRFVKFYDRYKVGLAAYFQKAIDYYCDNKGGTK